LPTHSLIAIYAFAFVVSFGAVVSPGPVSAAIISESPRQGWRVGPLVATAHVALEALIVILIGVGLTAGMANGWVQTAIALGGGAMLLYIGGSYLLGAWRGSIRLPRTQTASPPRSTGSLLSLGLVTTLSNPFWYAWWVTVAAGFLAQARPLGPAGPAAFYFGHISADYAWDSVLAAATSYGGRWLSDRLYRAVILVTGGFMGYLGLLFLRTGMQLASG
jgi:threonine/homoserine/homoserine lactone efflux protein